MRTREDIYRENKGVAVVMMFIVAILAKLVEHLYLPDKYYYDNNRILGTMLDPNYKDKWGGSYEIAADFFRNINIFNIDSFLEWSIYLGIVFNVIVIIIFLTCKGVDLKQTFFVLMCVGLLNIYIFNIGKEVIQIGIFSLIFLSIKLKLPEIIKVILCFGILYWESTFFRNYYIIMAFFFITVYAGIIVLRKLNLRMSIFKVVIIIGLLYFMVFVFLYLANVFMHENYIDIMTCKEDTTQLLANSTIDDKIEHGENIGLFMANYIINSLRMAFPIELLKAGAFYIPFVLFEGFLIYYMGKAIANIYKLDNNQILALSVMLGFYFGSVLFEPDFGSFVRHEASSFPVIFILAFNDNYWVKEEG